MATRPTPYQNVFLNELRKKKTGVTMFLMNGFQLRGTVTAFDDFAVWLDSDGKQSMIYKHAISTIAPAVGVRLEEATAE